MTERHLEHKETLSNGCSIVVKAEILRDGSLKMFIGRTGYRFPRTMIHARIYWTWKRRWIGG